MAGFERGCGYSRHPIFVGGGGGLVTPGRMVAVLWDPRKVMTFSCGFRDTRWLQEAVVFSLESKPPDSDEF